MIIKRIKKIGPNFLELNESEKKTVLINKGDIYAKVSKETHFVSIYSKYTNESLVCWECENENDTNLLYDEILEELASYSQYTA